MITENKWMWPRFKPAISELWCGVLITTQWPSYTLMQCLWPTLRNMRILERTMVSIHTIKPTKTLKLKLYVFYTKYNRTPTCFDLSWSYSGRT